MSIKVKFHPEFEIWLHSLSLIIPLDNKPAISFCMCFWTSFVFLSVLSLEFCHPDLLKDIWYKINVYIFKVYLITFDICIYSWSHYNHQDNEHIYCFRKFPPVCKSFCPALPSPQSPGKHWSAFCPCESGSPWGLRYVGSASMCVSVTDSCRWARRPPGSSSVLSVLQRVSEFPSFLRLSNTPLCGWAPFLYPRIRQRTLELPLPLGCREQSRCKHGCR
mgnify:CR=1 FL=1